MPPHVLILQHPIADRRSVHLSYYDVAQHSLGIRRQVCVLPAQLLRILVLDHLGWLPSCDLFNHVD